MIMKPDFLRLLTDFLDARDDHNFNNIEETAEALQGYFKLRLTVGPSLLLSKAIMIVQMATTFDFETAIDMAEKQTQSYYVDENGDIIRSLDDNSYLLINLRDKSMISLKVDYDVK